MSNVHAHGRPLAAALLVLALTAAGCQAHSHTGTPVHSSASPASSIPAATATPKKRKHRQPRPHPLRPTPTATTTPTSSAPLAGIRIALDPGHQLGNSHFPSEINRLVDAGDGKKACNTTGTSTNAGVPEATINWEVTTLVAGELRRLGATVLLTRTSNSSHLWGPCVDVRGRFPERTHAQLMVSLHSDGHYGGHGFHVIAPLRRGASSRLAGDLRDRLEHAGLAPSTYVGGGTGLDVRGDLGTLNLSSLPVAMIEMGNLRDAGDAGRLTSASGQRQYADAVVTGIRAYLRR